jgi:tetratricopeptide (TPR) repeat protein
MHGFDSTFGFKICLHHKQEALNYLQEAFTIRTQISDLQGLAGTKGFMAYLFEIEGELDKALELYEENYDFYYKMNELNGQIVELLRMAEIRIKQKDLVQSSDLTTKAFELANKYGNPKYVELVKNLIKEVVELSK